MQNISGINHKLIEVSHIKIGVQLLKLWNLEVQYWVPFWKLLEIRKNQTWKWAKIWTLF